MSNKKLPNNNKITSYDQNQEKVKKFFLEKASDSNKAPVPYLVEDEFNKTKKNYTNSNLFILLTSCTLIISSSLLFVYFYSKAQEKEKINIRIEEFSDINIQNVLIQVNNFKNDLLEKKKEMIELKKQKEDDLQEIFTLYDDKIREIVSDNTLDGVFKRSKTQVFFNEKKQQEAIIIEKYAGKINSLQNKIDDLVKKVSLLDQQAIEQAIKTDDFAGYQGKLLDARIEIIEKNYQKTNN